MIFDFDFWKVRKSEKTWTKVDYSENPNIELNFTEFSPSTETSIHRAIYRRTTQDHFLTESLELYTDKDK